MVEKILHVFLPELFKSKWIYPFGRKRLNACLTGLQNVIPLREGILSCSLVSPSPCQSLWNKIWLLLVNKSGVGQCALWKSNCTYQQPWIRAVPLSFSCFFICLFCVSSLWICVSRGLQNHVYSLKQILHSVGILWEYNPANYFFFQQSLSNWNFIYIQSLSRLPVGEAYP